MIYKTVIYYTILYYTILHYTILYYTILYYDTISYNMIYNMIGRHDPAERGLRLPGHADLHRRP